MLDGLLWFYIPETAVFGIGHGREIRIYRHPSGDERRIRLYVLGTCMGVVLMQRRNDWRWKAHHVTYVNRETGMQVELHWKMNQDCGKEPDFEELWSRKRIFADRIAYLSEQDMFLQLIQHGARHGWFRLR